MPDSTATAGCGGAWNGFESYSAHHARLAETNFQSDRSQDTRCRLRVFALAILLFLAVSAPTAGAEEPAPRWALYSYHVGLIQGSDLISTEMFLSVGAKEGNKRVEDRGFRISSKVAVGILCAEVDRQISLKSWRWARWVWRGALFVMHFPAVKKNIAAWNRNR